MKTPNTPTGTGPQAPNSAPTSSSAATDRGIFARLFGTEEEREQKRILKDEKKRRELEQRDQALLDKMAHESDDTTLTAEDIARGKVKAPKKPANAPTASAADVQQDQVVQKKGREYFDQKCKESKDDKDMFYENRYNLRTLVALLKNHRQSKLKKRVSLLEKMNLDTTNLVQLFQAIFASMTQRAITEGEIVELVDHKGLTPEYIIYDRIFHFGDTTSQDEINKAIKLFNEAMGKFTGWRNLCSFRGGTIDQPNVALEIYNTIKALKEIENVQNPEEYSRERATVLDGANLPNYQNALIDAKTIQSVLDGLKPKPAEDEKLTDEVFVKLYDQADMSILNTFEDAFRDADIFEAIKEHNFGGRPRAEVVDALNTKFPGKNLGNLLIISSKQNNRLDLIKRIAERFGITTKNALLEQIKKINEAIKELYPNVAGDQVQAGGGSYDLFSD